MGTTPFDIESEPVVLAEAILSTDAASARSEIARRNSHKVLKRIALVVITVPTLGVLWALGDLVLTGFVAWKFILLGLFYVLTLFGVEAGFHRLISHGAYATPLRDLIVVLGSMAAQGPAIFWAATHRQHHAFSDENGDPHSPRRSGPGSIGVARGFFHGHFGWLLKADQVDWNRFAPDLIKDRRLFALNQAYPIWVVLGLALPAGLGAFAEVRLGGGLLMGAWNGFIWGGLARIFLVHHAVWAVNSVCHVQGRRPLPCKGTSGNVAWLALPTLGGAWHNNHHAFPFTADNQFAWWQVDCSGLIIRSLRSVGLVTHLKKPSNAAIKTRKSDAQIGRFRT
jgi:stearoyl-CoA desaturase (delta-9 desaturase)